MDLFGFYNILSKTMDKIIERKLKIMFTPINFFEFPPAPFDFFIAGR